MNGLDVRARIMLKEVLKDMRASGRTVIFSSHILSDMAEICDEVGIFHAGNFKFISTLEAFKIQTNKPNLEEGFMQVIE
jgi:ABC-type Na+ transport system ATPase subunit NatA